MEEEDEQLHQLVSKFLTLFSPFSQGEKYCPRQMAPQSQTYLR